MQLSVSLGAVISQSLLPLKTGGGRVPAFEIMIATSAIRSVIREGKTHMIYNQIQAGRDEGMVVLDQYLADLVRQDLVDYNLALARSSYPNEFARRCGRGTDATASGPAAEEA
jgi:twitching motility protein PilT